MIAAPEFVAKRIIASTLRNRFRRVYWMPPASVQLPAVFAANHFTWHDGFLLATACWQSGFEPIGLVEDRLASQLFKNIGAVPIPRSEPMGRGLALKRAIGMMRSGRLLTLFPEGVLHPPGELLPFQFGVDFIARVLPTTQFFPIAIHTELCFHERPEAWVRFGEPMAAQPNLAGAMQASVESMLEGFRLPHFRENDRWQTLVEGKSSGHERGQNR